MKWFLFGKSKKVKEGKEVCLWLAFCWNIWSLRNGIIFRNDRWNILDVVWNIKATVWSCGLLLVKLLTPIGIFTILAKTRCFFYRNRN